MNREKAEAHWGYTKWIVEHGLEIDRGMEHLLKLMGYLYVEAMIHGYKHGADDAKEKDNE